MSIQTRLHIKNGKLILITTPPPKTKPNYIPKTCKWCNKIFTPKTPHYIVVTPVVIILSLNMQINVNAGIVKDIKIRYMNLKHV